MDHNILINSLLNGEQTVKTNSEGTSFTETRPPTRCALMAAKVIQQLQAQHDFSSNTINQLTKERNELMSARDIMQQRNNELQDEIKSLQAFKVGDGTK